MRLCGHDAEDLQYEESVVLDMQAKSSIPAAWMNRRKDLKLEAALLAKKDDGP